ncbi:TonB family protein [Aestuariicella hydrocarbonica]|uniref:TonB family protein n=1 Tax=Pseudomaricurvus hydrocarbonicus TaxID=1470433 RepID=A0A9E5MNV9_9GAMM|nr:energy transducer TonB [Aestuariicella hydrocarbonica]NHO67634.1 TonB family protein [Aestuariicella hydrocarbonica]
MAEVTAPENTPPLNNPAVSTGDRLSFTVFLAIALHALLILGITFNAQFGGKPSPTLEITLATHSSLKAPEKADFLAQSNQEASGTGDRAQQMTTDKLAPISDTRIQDINPTPQVRAANPTKQEVLQPVVTQNSSRFKIEQQETTPEIEEQQKKVGKDLQDTPLSAEIASLQAKLDRQRQAIAKRPRIRRITSVATRASMDAAYLNKWTHKVEAVGNSNFPVEAIHQKIYGQLRLATILRPNGTIHSVEILQSSGHSVLDNAALQIVHMAAPFPPFPNEMRKDVDQLEIIRTWHFELSGLSTTSNYN